MSPRVKIAVSTGVGGWCFVHLENPTFRLYVRVEAFDSPVIDEEMRSRSFDIPQFFKVVELHIDGDGYVLDADYLRKIPLAAIEAIINTAGISERIFLELDSRGYVSLEVARDLSHFQSLQGNKVSRTKKIEIPTNLGEQIRRPSITRPKKLDEEFLLRVAEFYRVAISLNERPIKTLSQSAKVPRDTAARWVKLARERGFLVSSKVEGETSDK